MAQEKFSHRERVYEGVVDWCLRQKPAASIEPPRICWDRYPETDPIWVRWYEMRPREIYPAMQRRSTYGGGEAPRARREEEASARARGENDDAPPQSGVQARVA